MPRIALHFNHRADDSEAEWLGVFNGKEPDISCDGCTRKFKTIGGVQYIVVTFTKSGSFTATKSLSGMEVLMVGGGGSGGWRCGGGGDFLSDLFDLIWISFWNQRDLQTSKTG